MHLAVIASFDKGLDTHNFLLSYVSGADPMDLCKQALQQLSQSFGAKIRSLSQLKFTKTSDMVATTGEYVAVPWIDQKPFGVFDLI
jgi:hypothetical protein